MDNQKFEEMLRAHCESKQVKRITETITGNYELVHDTVTILIGYSYDPEEFCLGVSVWYDDSKGFNLAYEEQEFITQDWTLICYKIGQLVNNLVS
jgi:hypothetical protein